MQPKLITSINLTFVLIQQNFNRLLFDPITCSLQVLRLKSLMWQNIEQQNLQSDV